MNVTIVGIGAMGGGMARALLESDATKTVVGYDTNHQAVDIFFAEARAAKKSFPSVPKSLSDAITSETNIVVISLVNEEQCEQVRFGGDENLWKLLPKGSCVVLTSTVTAMWAKKADTTFRAAGIHFVDSPVSGGPARARLGDLTLMASGEEECLKYSRLVLDSLAREVHVIDGGAGAGSTVKCVHQLLAGVHICVAAEAMAMGAKAGINVAQLYEIVNGAAGASWMFTDRGQRMLEEDPEVKSALAIFVKDLDIVYAEAKRLMSPIPVATAALQQFISGQSLGLGGSDDSQVVKVYENVTGVKVVGTVPTTGTIVVCNEILKVSKRSGFAGPLFELYKEDLLTISLDQVQIQIQVLKSPPMSNTTPLATEMHDLIMESDKFRVYKLTLPAGESCSAAYPFFHVTIATTQAQLKISLPTLTWKDDIRSESITWSPPVTSCTLTNCGSAVYCQYLVELL